VKNDGHDNEHSDLVLYVSDVLVHNNPSNGTSRTYTIQEMLGQVRAGAGGQVCWRAAAHRRGWQLRRVGVAIVGACTEAGMSA